MTPEQQVDAVRAALAEAGYPDAHVQWVQDCVAIAVKDAPTEVRWRARAVVGRDVACWPCYLANQGKPAGTAPTCTHDWRTAPWPEVVR